MGTIVGDHTIETAGLRQRKKTETRTALAQAALSIALERGLEAATADAIAAAANVSPRTFHNYFGGKEEALVAGWRGLLEAYVAQVLARPVDEPILTSLEAVLGGIAAEAAAHRDETVQHLDLLFSPALGAQRALLIEEVVRALTGIVALRTGTDPRTDVYPRLVTTAAVSAVVTAYDLAPPEGDRQAEAPRRLRECFALLRAGLERPPERTT
jgi:AcrR family transcriptional regulator